MFQYSYGGVGRLTGIGSGGQTVASYSYDDARRLARRDLINGVSTDLGYEPLLGRLAQAIKPLEESHAVS